MLSNDLFITFGLREGARGEDHQKIATSGEFKTSGDVGRRGFVVRCARRGSSAMCPLVPRTERLPESPLCCAVCTQPAVPSQHKKPQLRQIMLLCINIFIPGETKYDNESHINGRGAGKKKRESSRNGLAGARQQHIFHSYALSHFSLAYGARNRKLVAARRELEDFFPLPRQQIPSHARGEVAAVWGVTLVQRTRFFASSTPALEPTSERVFLACSRWLCGKEMKGKDENEEHGRAEERKKLKC
jgi:hypothetical protein